MLLGLRETSPHSSPSDALVGETRKYFENNWEQMRGGLGVDRLDPPWPARVSNLDVRTRCFLPCAIYARVGAPESGRFIHVGRGWWWSKLRQSHSGPTSGTGSEAISAREMLAFAILLLRQRQCLAPRQDDFDHLRGEFI